MREVGVGVATLEGRAVLQVAKEARRARTSPRHRSKCGAGCGELNFSGPTKYKFIY